MDTDSRSCDVNPSNPLGVPYRTGSYLISDVGPDNFRTAMNLNDRPYLASGSHQLGTTGFIRVLDQVVSSYRPRRIFLVDLREETHGFFDGSPVSWYSDNDFSNVGQEKEWILLDEEDRLAHLQGKRTKIFEIEDDASDDLQQERVIPISYTETYVSRTQTEADVARVLAEVFAPVTIDYIRIPVTDHCAPGALALNTLRTVFNRARGTWSDAAGKYDTWVHFHCHGGDGRTTTFLALYDMLCWRERSGEPLPSLEEFVWRQCELFSYCLDPSGCESCGTPPKPWQLPLAWARWNALNDFLTSL